MKEPEGHEASANDYEPSCCVEDGQPWPCKTWRKWTASKDCRITELEATVKRLADRAGSQERQLHRLEQTVREDSNILRNGVFRAMADLGRHERMGNLTLNWSRDPVDVTPAGAAWRELAPGTVDLTVKYEDVDGRTWTNGAITDQDLRGG